MFHARLVLILASFTLALSADFEVTRRPHNGRPFKAIVVTSKPFGLADKEENAIKTRPSTPATPTTTGSSFEYKIAQPTIPFFSISCSVGSSCSQIISARKVPTPKPTFRPYTKEDKEKYKLVYSQVFGPTAQLSASLSETAKRTTTTTTVKPTTSSIWRVRTTPRPMGTGAPTTKSKPTLSSAIKEFAINSALESVSKWKWPGDAVNNRNSMVVQSAPVKLVSPSDNNNKNAPSMSKWLSSLLLSSINNAISQKKVQQFTPETNEITAAGPVNEPLQQPTPFVGKEVVNTKGHRTTIITGSSVRQQVKTAQTSPVQQRLPPEFTVSSHGIRLQVVPKTRSNAARFVHSEQGVDVEVDDEDVNLSELIMKHHPVASSRAF